MGLDYLLPLGAAAGLAGLIGAEREAEGKAAGFRTHLLIGLGAALLSLLSLEVALGRDFADPGRIAAQIVSGIGFVGAGAIIQSRASVRGITTAATLWVAAAIGMACAFEQYVPAAIATALALFSLRGLRLVDRFFQRRPRWYTLELTTEQSHEALDEALRRQMDEPTLRRWQVTRAFVREGRYGCVVRVRASRDDVTRLVGQLHEEPDGVIADVQTV